MKRKAKNKAIAIKKNATGKITKPIKRKYSDEIIAMVLDRKEEQLITSELAGKLVDKLGWIVRNKEGEIIMQDLTYIGYRELARNTMRVKFNEPKETYMAEEKLWAVRIEAVNTDTGENQAGAAEVSAAYQSGARNAFPYRSAITKAQRNALKQLIPISKRITMFDMYMKNKATKTKIETIVLDQETVNKTLPVVPETEKALRGIFAKINDMKLDKEAMHEFLKKEYDTEHLRSLPLIKLKEIYTRLSKTAADPQRVVDMQQKFAAKGGNSDVKAI